MPRLRPFLAAFSVLLLASVAANSQGQLAQAADECTTDCYVSELGDDNNSGQTVVNAFRTLQKAVDTVQDGGTIHVEPGLYDVASTTVAKSVTFLGAQAGVDPTDAGSGRVPGNLGAESVIRSDTGLGIHGDNLTVIVDGFNFEPMTPTSSIGILVGSFLEDSNSDVTIINNIFSMGPDDGGIGAQLLGDGPSSLDINHNLFIDSVDGISVGGSMGSTVTVTENKFENLSGAAFELLIGRDVEFSNNELLDVSDSFRDPVMVGGCFNCTISNNTFIDPGGFDAISLIGSDGPSFNGSITGNVITNPKDPFAWGIYIALANSTFVSNNTITGSIEAGITIDYIANDTQVSNNTISGPEWGIFVRHGTFGEVGSGVDVGGNEIADTTEGIRVERPARVLGNSVTTSATGIAVYENADLPDTHIADTHINGNSIAGNTAGLTSVTAKPVDAACNWWGSASGPSGVGPGTGDSITANAVFAPWLPSENPGNPCQRDVHQCDGNVDALDVQAVLNELVAADTGPQPTAPCDGDVNFDGEVDVADAIAMARVTAGLPVN